MDAYIYQAALYCENCGTDLTIDLARSNGECSCRECDGRHSRDSDAFPQGPYPNGGGEADTPQHCDRCGVFLENPLTEDGREFVREHITMARDSRATQQFVDTTFEWRAFYGEAIAR